jgi:N-methylhydantoinase A/oxoprolinase/acetone carboxylase beta subunit
MSSEFAEMYPVFTFASGPTNSMRGAAYLSGVKDAIVVDIGGTTADCGILIKGFPRQSSAVVEVGEVRTNFRMPDVFSFGLGIYFTQVEEKITVIRWRIESCY